MVHHGGELAVQMRGEPVCWSQTIHHVFRSCASQGTGSSVRREQIFLFEQSLPVSLPLDTPWPIVADTNIYLGSDLHQLPDFHLTDVIDASDIILVVRETFMVRLVVIVAFPDP